MIPPLWTHVERLRLLASGLRLAGNDETAGRVERQADALERDLRAWDMRIEIIRDCDRIPINPSRELLGVPEEKEKP